MSKVITVSRELGSGGREVGLRLAKTLGIPFYDKELIAMTAEDSNISEDLFHANDEVIAGQKRINYDDYATVDPFSPVYEVPVSDQLFVIQSKIIQRLAANGPCVIIGRCADYVLRDEEPFRIFLYAELEFKMKRCRERGDDAKKMSDRELQRHMAQIDKKRAEYYAFLSGQKWGAKENYDLCINTSTADEDKIVNSITELYR